MLKNYAVKKFLGLYVFLLLLIPVTVAVSMPNSKTFELRSKANVNTNTLTFWPNNAVLDKDKDYSVQLKISNVKKPKSLDLVLTFNPNVVNILGTGAIPGNTYTTYHAQHLDNQKGIVGLSGNEAVDGGNVFMTLKIHTLSPGDANFKVDYLNAPDEKVEVELPKLSVR